jgi:ADP-ribosylglycohydrolase
VAAAYISWRRSGPFDIGTTTSTGIAALERGQLPVSDSEANGGLMRVAPIGIACAGNPTRAAAWAAADAGLTHPSPVCRAASGAFAAAIAIGIAGGSGAEMIRAAEAHASDGQVRSCIRAAKTAPPAEFQREMGWVLIALQNAFHHLQAGTPLEEALITTVAKGGDTDTNTAICGALLGAAQGRDALPLRWRNAVLTCRPSSTPGHVHPRPAPLWPDRALTLAETLLALSEGRMK